MSSTESSTRCRQDEPPVKANDTQWPHAERPYAVTRVVRKHSVARRWQTEGCRVQGKQRRDRGYGGVKDQNKHLDLLFTSVRAIRLRTRLTESSW